ncbi:hypothetical protein P171DRAFT_93561 [Karstenula rhodostoma CBS 690.94]|uniref:Uncharacterized protein n=1 Tax=Karstenula rhodostoma CBS 690.94 TaxID=1392251 RepID=A0A9P4PC84_9PLEO|nr:hypothetical protein P171DRAFT_93561 [Karstenula rhodostoma CBS 690.94]
MADGRTVEEQRAEGRANRGNVMCEVHSKVKAPVLASFVNSPARLGRELLYPLHANLLPGAWCQNTKVSILPTSCKNACASLSSSFAFFPFFFLFLFVKRRDAEQNEHPTRNITSSNLPCQKRRPLLLAHTPHPCTQSLSRGSSSNMSDTP